MVQRDSRSAGVSSSCASPSLTASDLPIDSKWQCVEISARMEQGLMPAALDVAPPPGREDRLRAPPGGGLLFDASLTAPPPRSQSWRGPIPCNRAPEGPPARQDAGCSSVVLAGGAVLMAVCNLYGATPARWDECAVPARSTRFSFHLQAMGEPDRGSALPGPQDGRPTRRRNAHTG